MNTRIVLLLTTAAVVAAIAGCASRPAEPPAAPVTEKSVRGDKRSAPHASASHAGTAEAYKRELAQRISEANPASVYSGRPQALLRSVIVVRYAVDAQGHLVQQDIVRSNRDSETESIAMASLRNAAPFPRPASHLLRRGRFELSETWLFNNDGRFQIRTVAQPQMDQ